MFKKIALVLNVSLRIAVHHYLIARIVPKAVKTQVVELIALDLTARCAEFTLDAKSPTSALSKIALLTVVRLTLVQVG